MNDEIEVMRIVRVPPMGSLVVVVGDKRFTKLAQVDDDAEKHRLLAAIGELIVFADGYDALVSAGVAPPAAGPTKAPAQIASSLEERRAAFLSSLERQNDISSSSSGLAATESQLTGATGRDSKSTSDPVQNLDIVSQIDAILQKHVASDPKLSGRKIRLEQSPAGGLRINVDGTYFERPGDVSEIGVKIALKAALQEWEAG